MENTYEVYRRNFSIADEDGNFYQDELINLKTKILSSKPFFRPTRSLLDCYESKNVDITKIQPCKNHDGYVCYIDYHSYFQSCDKNEPLDGEIPGYDYPISKEEFFIYNIGSALGYELTKEGEDLFRNTPMEKNSTILFEMLSGDEYSTIILEKCYLFAGIYMANNIMINIPEDYFIPPFTKFPFDTIYKTYYAYINAIESSTIDKFDKKKFWICVRQLDHKRYPNENSLNLFFQPKDYLWHCKEAFEFLSLFLSEMQLEVLKFARKIDANWGDFSNGFFDFNLVYMPQNKSQPWQLNPIKEVMTYLIYKGEKTLWWQDDFERRKNELGCDLVDENNLIKTELLEGSLLRYKQHEIDNRWYWKNNYVYYKTNCIEIIAEQACSRVASIALELLKCVMAPWHKLINSGWVQGLGQELDHLIEKVQEFYKREAGIFGLTDVFERKQDLLEEIFFIESRVMFQPQMNYLKENLKNYFKSSCNNIGLTDEIERDLNQLINLFDEEFVNQAESSIPDIAKKDWNYTYERENLKRYMIELVDEKMKMTYFKGLLVKKVKTPISIWFHALFPHPFGKDLSNEPFTTEDNFSFDTRERQRNTKAIFMRYILSRKIDWDKPMRDRAIRTGWVPEEDYVFKENPKKAIKRLEKNR